MKCSLCVVSDHVNCNAQSGEQVPVDGLHVTRYVRLASEDAATNEPEKMRTGIKLRWGRFDSLRAERRRPCLKVNQGDVPRIGQVANRIVKTASVTTWRAD
jgi:hypothetical protein